MSSPWSPPSVGATGSACPACGTASGAGTASVPPPWAFPCPSTSTACAGTPSSQAGTRRPSARCAGRARGIRPPRTHSSASRSSSPSVTSARTNARRGRPRAGRPGWRRRPGVAPVQRAYGAGRPGSPRGYAAGPRGESVTNARRSAMASCRSAACGRRPRARRGCPRRACPLRPSARRSRAAGGRVRSRSGSPADSRSARRRASAGLRPRARRGLRRVLSRRRDWTWLPPAPTELRSARRGVPGRDLSGRQRPAQPQRAFVQAQFLVGRADRGGVPAPGGAVEDDLGELGDAGRGLGWPRLDFTSRAIGSALLPNTSQQRNPPRRRHRARTRWPRLCVADRPGS